MCDDTGDPTFSPTTILLSYSLPGERPQVALLAWIAFYWNVGVVLWGAYVRAPGSGAGCGNRWPPAMGRCRRQRPNHRRIHAPDNQRHGVAYGDRSRACCWRVTKKEDWALYSAILAAARLANEAPLGAALVLLNRVGNDQSVGPNSLSVFALWHTL